MIAVRLCFILGLSPIQIVCTVVYSTRVGFAGVRSSRRDGLLFFGSSVDGVRLIRNHDRRAAGGRDLAGGRAAELGGVHLEFLRECPIPQDLDTVESVALDQSLHAKGLFVDDRARLEL